MSNATAIAQAADALEQAAQVAKRGVRTHRELLKEVRQAQAALAAEGLIAPEMGVRALGIEIETQPNGGTVDGIRQENPGR